MKSLELHSLLLVLALVSPATFAQNGKAPVTPEQPAASTAPGPATPNAVQPELGEVVKRLRAFISDDELALIYDFMSNSALAALRGGEVEPVPPELEFKLAILRERFYKEGNVFMQNFMQFLQQELDATLKKLQPPAPLPPIPYPPPSSSPKPPSGPERS